MTPPSSSLSPSSEAAAGEALGVPSEPSPDNLIASDLPEEDVAALERQAAPEGRGSQSADEQTAVSALRPGDLLSPAAPIQVHLPPRSVILTCDLGPAGDAIRAKGPPPHPNWVGTRRVVLVSPCYNRAADAEALVDDALKLDQRGVDLRMVLVDNASDKPLSQMRFGLGPTPPTHPYFRLEHLRQSDNAGGSGGYNAGLRRALEYALDPSKTDSLGRPGQGWAADYIWMVDSDVRLAPDTLWKLITEMERDRSIVAAGSTLADPLTGQGFELGGHVNRKSGWWEPHCFGMVGVREVIDTDYLAACCALVRADAVRATGVMPDNFLHGDDVEWTRRMQDVTGGRVVCVPWAVAMHPHFSRFATWTRYYTGRSAFGTLAAVERGFKVRFKRSFVEVRRAVQQALNDREDLARLHVRALLDASRGVVTGKAAPGVIDVLPSTPLKSLEAELDRVFTAQGWATPQSRARLRVKILPALQLTYREEAQVFLALEALGVRSHERVSRYRRSFAGELFDFALRLLGLARRPDVAIAPARGQAFCWLSAPVIVQVWTGNAVLRRPRRLSRLVAGTRFAFSALWAALRASLKTPPQARMYPGRLARPSLSAPTAPRATTVCAVVLSHNRREKLEQTLAALLDHPVFAPAAPTDQSSGAVVQGRVIVADNASADGTVDAVVQRFADFVEVLAIDENIGVEAFNRAVDHALADTRTPHEDTFLLILDDDAVVEPEHFSRAVELLARRDDLAAVTFHPRHPDTAMSEWPFAEVLAGAPCDDWPVMGCANLVRASAWRNVGGYEGAFFLYRNDTDLALRLASAVQGPRAVYFDPRWTVWHDSGSGQTNAACFPLLAPPTKSTRWHRTATRNWCWTCRRSAPRAAALRASLMGWAWAHRLAGLSPARHGATLVGALSGLLTRAPATNGSRSDGVGLRRLLELRALHRRMKKQRRASER